jgi:hypothetical protein
LVLRARTIDAIAASSRMARNSQFHSWRSAMSISTPRRDAEPLEEMIRGGPAVILAIFVVLLFVGVLLRMAAEACGMLRCDPGEV